MATCGDSKQSPSLVQRTTGRTVPLDESSPTRLPER
ncbi:hypothetical protein APTSU1_001395200 [Apodemus speciosus]|uniref:Uncharacterized protein n=1 Tax=Apodemus speciosus TaxID=105296 RepID=A0ABQ0FHI9_APOSI